MNNTITIPGWRGHLGRGLAPRELEATMLAANDLTMKEIAQHMGIDHRTVAKRLTDARDKLGYQRSIRGLTLEALRRGIIAPLAIALLFGTGHMQQAQTVRRPTAPRTHQQARIVRKVDELTFSA